MLASWKTGEGEQNQSLSYHSKNINVSFVSIESSVHEKSEPHDKCLKLQAFNVRINYKFSHERINSHASKQINYSSITELLCDL